MLLNRAALIFAGRRVDVVHEAWQMPQGGLDAGEAPRAAMLRELEEETGIAPRLVEVLAESRDWLRYDLPEALVPLAWGGRYRGQEQKWFAARFLGHDSEVNVATAHAEFEAWRWAARDELLSTIVPFKRPLYAAIFAEFAAFLRPPKG
jgi:putative (di)nucleoside polyphosphate hydrolase